jgi:hypothetical protein
MRFVAITPPAGTTPARGPTNLVFVTSKVGFAATTGGSRFVPRAGDQLPSAPGTIERTDDGTWWVGPREAARRLNVDEHLPSPRPDGAFELVCPAGSIECYLEWDSGTETRQRLHDKLLAYLQVHELWDYKQWPPLNLLFVVPGAGRLATLEGAVADLRENGKWKGYPFFTAWGPHAATAEDIARQGPLEPVWWPLTGDGRTRSLTELAPYANGGDPAAALGRSWRHDRADFWERLSPPAPKAPKPPHARESEADLRLSGVDGLMPDPLDKEGS